MIQLVSLIIEDSGKRFSHDQTVAAKLMLNGKEALTSSGVKSGTPGEPFPFDLHLKELLEKELPGYEHHSRTQQLLNNALHDTMRDIARERSTHKEEW